MIRKSGFTLAEILITLTIIGVVSSMTVPTMVQNIQDIQYRTAWKKAYSELDQATRLMLADNGGSIKNKCGWDWNDGCLKNLYLPYFRHIRNCNSNQAFGNCWHNDASWKFLSGNYVNSGWGNAASIVLSDGKMIRFGHISDSCTYQAETSAALPECGYIVIDINGFNEPNTYGRDIYNIHVFENMIMPYGMQGDKYPSNTDCTKAGLGFGCAALYLYQ